MRLTWLPPALGFTGPRPAASWLPARGVWGAAREGGQHAVPAPAYPATPSGTDRDEDADLTGPGPREPLFPRPPGPGPCPGAAPAGRRPAARGPPSRPSVGLTPAPTSTSRCGCPRPGPLSRASLSAASSLASAAAHPRPHPGPEGLTPCASGHSVWVSKAPSLRGRARGRQAWPSARPPPPARLPLLGAVLGHRARGPAPAFVRAAPAWAASENALSRNGFGGAAWSLGARGPGGCALAGPVSAAVRRGKGPGEAPVPPAGPARCQQRGHSRGPELTAPRPGRSHRSLPRGARRSSGPLASRGHPKIIQEGWPPQPRPRHEFAEMPHPPKKPPSISSLT